MSGVDRVVRDGPTRYGLHAHAVGLITNPTGLTKDFVPTAAGLQSAGLPLVALLGPEHGLAGSNQAGFGVTPGTSTDGGIGVYDTYGRSDSELIELIRSARLDHLVFDIQDVGSRFYTYVWTMADCMLAAATADIPFTVLDRPNPIGGTISEGHPTTDTSAWLSSFVGRIPIPIRHGLTVGELANHINATFVDDRLGRPADLRVVAVSGWDPSRFLDSYANYPWVMPSPNLPTIDTAMVYPGTCLFEGTNLSEGRGTTRPFELIGAPFVDSRLASACQDRGLPGVVFRECSFEPWYGKFRGQVIRGLQLHVTDRATFRPVLTALTMLDEIIDLYPAEFQWRVTDSGAESTVSHHPIDLLWGSPALRRAHRDGAPLSLLTGDPGPPNRWFGDAPLLYDRRLDPAWPLRTKP